MKRITTAILIVLLIACVLVFVACNSTNKNDKPTNIALTAISGDVESVVINADENAVSCTVDNSVDSFELSQLVFSTTDGIDIAVFADADLTQSVSKMELAVGENTFFIKVTGDKEIVYKLTITRKEAPHVHTFSDKWSYNDTEHWHVATCEHTSETVGKSLHTWDNGTETIPATEGREGIKTFICTVCGASKIEPIAKLTHTHTISTDWSSDAFYHWHTASCGRVEHNTDKAAHSWDNGVITTPATEESEGVRTYLCTICGATKTESVDKLAHTHTISTDWSSDEFYHWHAASCGKTEHNTSKAAHTWDSGVVTTPATEESEGSMSYLCTVCGYTKTEPIAKLTHVHMYETEWTIDENYHWHVATCGHDVIKDKAVHAWGNGSIIKEATEEETGIMFFVCSICGKTKEIVTPQLDHTHKFSEDWTSDDNYHWHIAVCEHSDQISGKSAHIWDSGIVTEPATEEKSGIMTYSCTVCAKEKTEIIAQLPHTHTYETDWSCDETYHWHAANCEHTSLFKDKDMHAWNDGVITKEPTETAEGIRMYTCLICNNTKNETIPKLPHSHTFDLEHWVSDSDNHWHPATCEHTDEVFSLAEHNWVDDSIIVEATETIQGQKQQRCSLCNRTRVVSIGFAEHTHTFDLSTWISDADFHWHAATCEHSSEMVDKDHHTWNNGEVILAATEQLGEQTQYTCTICGKTKTETTSEPLPHVHTYNTAQWEYNSLYHWNPATCEHTNEKGNKAEHTWGEWVETIEATEDTFGEQTRTCTICGKTQTQEIPKLPHTFSDEWSYDETYHWHAATCGHDAKDDYAVHNWSNPIETKQATIYEEGETTYTCSVCGETKTVPIEVLPSYSIEFWSNLEMINQDRVAVDSDYHTYYNPDEMDGYYFLGWSNTTYDEDNDEYTLSSNYITQHLDNNVIRITANYGLIYTVSYLDYNGFELDMQTLIVPIGEVGYATSFTPTRAGYVFDAWYIEDEVYDFNSPVTSNISLNARYIKMYTVTFVDYNGTTLYVASVAEGDNAYVENPTREGYTFYGWSESVSNVCENLTVSAQYMLNTYRITFKAKGKIVPYVDENGEAHEYQIVSHFGSAVAPTLGNNDLYYIDWGDYKGYAFTKWNADFNNVVSDMNIEAEYLTLVEQPILAVKTDMLKEISLFNVSGTYNVDISIVLLYSGNIYGLSMGIIQDNNNLKFGYYSLFPDSYLSEKTDVIDNYTSKQYDENDNVTLYQAYTWSRHSGAALVINGRKEALRITYNINAINTSAGEYWINLANDASVINEDMVKLDLIVVSDFINITQ